MADIEYFLCMTTFNSEKEVKRIKNIVLTKRLAACINVIRDVESTYHCRDEIKQETEFIMLFKTKKYLLEKLKREVLVVHSYDIPEFIVLPITDGGLHYFNWIDREVLSEHEAKD